MPHWEHSIGANTWACKIRNEGIWEMLFPSRGNWQSKACEAFLRGSKEARVWGEEESRLTWRCRGPGRGGGMGSQGGRSCRESLLTQREAALSRDFTLGVRLLSSNPTLPCKEDYCCHPSENSSFHNCPKSHSQVLSKEWRTYHICPTPVHLQLKSRT